MKIIDTKIPDVKIFEPAVFGDERGFFFESFSQKNLMKLSAGMLILYRTTILNQAKVFCAVCTINLILMRKVN